MIIVRRSTQAHLVCLLLGAIACACTGGHSRLEAVGTSCDAIVETGSCVDHSAADAHCDASRRTSPCTRSFRFATCSTGTSDRHYYAVGHTQWNATSARRDCDTIGGTFRTEH